MVTPHPSVWQHVDNPEKTEADLRQEGVQRILTGHRWRCLSPSLNYWNRGPGWFIGGACRRIARRLGIDYGIGWIKAAEHACSNLTAKDVDIILASGPPFAAFTLAKHLSDRLDRPYVLDYRDPWTAGDPHPYGSWLDHLPQPVIIRREARLLADCAAVTIVSPEWRAILDSRFGVGPKLHVVTNGYDPEELENVKPFHFGHFAIVYAGIFYPPKRSISPVLAALKRLKETTNDQKREWYFHYYGPHEDHVREEARRFDIMERVVLHGNVPRAVVLSAVRGAGVTVVITSVAEEIIEGDKGIVPGKVFETIGLGSPMLLISPLDSDVEHVVGPTGLAQRFSGSDINGIALFFAEAMRGSAPEPREREMHAWTNIGRKMNTVLQSAVNRT